MQCLAGNLPSTNILTSHNVIWHTFPCGCQHLNMGFILSVSYTATSETHGWRQCWSDVYCNYFMMLMLCRTGWALRNTFAATFLKLASMTALKNSLGHYSWVFITETFECWIHPTPGWLCQVAVEPAMTFTVTFPKPLQARSETG